MTWFNRKKRPSRFLDLLAQQADLTVQGMEVVKR
jgi:hypothetical protein